MRLLVVNYAMDASSVVLGWQMRIVEELAARCEQVGVLTDSLGNYQPSPNVVVETFNHVPGRLAHYRALNIQAARMARTIRADAVFIHMAHRYAYLLAPAFKWLRLPVLVWYAHGSVSWHLRLALWTADRVVTSTPEGFRLSSPKVHIIGQGIDTDLFPLVARNAEQNELITVSRISARKRLNLLVETLVHLPSDIRLRVIGAPLTDEDRAYRELLNQQIAQHHLENRVIFTGAVPLDRLHKEYTGAFLHVNMSVTNSMDKSVLEALSCGCPVLTGNPAFHELLSEYPLMFMSNTDAKSIAARILDLRNARASFSPDKLRALVVGHHDQISYANRIMEQLDDLCRIR